MPDRKVQIEIPDSLAERLKSLAKQENFTDLNEYVTHLLRKAVSSGKEEESSLNPEEEEKIKERLKSLGYIE